MRCYRELSVLTTDLQYDEFPTVREAIIRKYKKFSSIWTTIIENNVSESLPKWLPSYLYAVQGLPFIDESDAEEP